MHCLPIETCKFVLLFSFSCVASDPRASGVYAGRHNYFNSYKISFSLSSIQQIYLFCVCQMADPIFFYT